MSGGEILKDRQAITETRLDRRLDDLTGGLGHQAPHTRQLTNLGHTSTSTGIDHDVDGIQVRLTLALVMFKRLDQVFTDLLGCMGPEVNNLVVAFSLGNHTNLVLFLYLHDLFLGRRKDLLLAVRFPQIVLGEGDTGNGSALEAELLEIIEQGQGRFTTEQLVAIMDNLVQVALVHVQVIEVHPLRQDVVEVDPAYGRLEDATLLRFQST